MSAYRITVAGLQYVGIYPSTQAAADAAERLYPHAWPAQVVCLPREAHHAR